MRQQALESFRDLVLAEPALQAELKGIIDRADFIEHVVMLGKTRGYEFTAEEVSLAMQESRRIQHEA